MTDIAMMIKQIVLMIKLLVRIMHFVLQFLPEVPESNNEWKFRNG